MQIYDLIIQKVGFVIYEAKHRNRQFKKQQMKSLRKIALLLGVHLFALTFAQESDSTQDAQAPSRWTVGGSVGLGGSFGSGNSSTVISLSPKVGYWLTSDLQGGLSTNFMWQNSKYFATAIAGLGPFLDYFVLPNFYLSSKYEHYFVSQKDKTTSQKISDSEPSLWFGLGYAQPIGGGSYLQIGGMYNVLYKKNTSLFSSGFSPMIGVVIRL